MNVRVLPIHAVCFSGEGENVHDPVPLLRAAADWFERLGDATLLGVALDYDDGGCTVTLSVEDLSGVLDDAVPA